jgi:cardiolipin synthase
LVRGGEDYFSLLLKLIGRAEHSIHLQVYIFDHDETGQAVANALIDAVRRGVKVFVLVDGYASQGLPQEFVSTLRTEGIYFRRFEPLLKSKHFYFGRRLHHKVIVIDGMHSLVGGMNISNRYNDLPDKPAWLDWGLYAEGDVSNALEKVCVQRMRYARVKSVKEVPKKSPVIIEERNCAVRVSENDWVRNKRQVYKSYLQMFREAKSHIIIMSPYFLPGNEFRKNMRLAVSRGVEVKLVLAGISDIYLSKHAERFVYRWLLKNKIKIYEYQKTVLHGKMAVCDGEWITVGSYNVNDLSAHASVELNLDVKNEHFAMHVEERLQHIIDTDCICITDEIYRRNTTLKDKIIQRFAYDFFRLVLFLFTFYFRRRE